MMLSGLRKCDLILHEVERATNALNTKKPLRRGNSIC